MIPVPSGVTLSVESDVVRVKGPKGEQVVPMLAGISLKTTEEGGKIAQVTTELVAGDTAHKANIGTMWSLVKNAIEGSSTGFLKTLEIQGVGFKAAMEGKTIILSLGFVNPVRFTPPEGVLIEVEKNLVKISGYDKQKVGQTASKIRQLKKPEPYKGKGIRYQGEVVRMKAGKKAATASK